MTKTTRISFVPVSTAFTVVHADFHDRGSAILSHEVIAIEPMIVFTTIKSDGQIERMLAKASVISQVSGRCYFAPFLGCLLSKMDSGKLALWVADQIEEAEDLRYSESESSRTVFIRYPGLSCIGLL